MTEADEALNLVPPPDDTDLFGSDRVLVEAVERHEAKDHLDRLSELGRLAGSPRTAGWADAADRTRRCCAPTTGSATGSTRSSSTRPGTG